jgi:uncharacterized protein YndB with AHSA1/START domain
MTDQIERELLVPATPKEVWDVITGPGWLAEDVQLELVPGGDAQFASGEELKTGWVEEALVPRTAADTGRLVFWWAGGGDPGTRVELTLEPEGDAATRLRVVEARPLDVLDVVGIPLPGSGGASYGGASYGPALLAAA